MIGNDLVDLKHTDAIRAEENRKFLDRVFNTEEILGIQKHPRGPNRRIWEIWALKESSFKAMRRINPQIPFAWREFEVRAADYEDSERILMQAQIVLCGGHLPEWKKCEKEYFRIKFRGLECLGFVLGLPGSDERIHAVAVWRKLDLHNRILLICETPDCSSESESETVRSSLASCIKNFSGYSDIRFRKDVYSMPVAALQKAGESVDEIVSFSHHGRWGGACILLPS